MVLFMIIHALVPLLRINYISTSLMHQTITLRHYINISDLVSCSTFLTDRKQWCVIKHLNTLVSVVVGCTRVG